MRQLCRAFLLAAITVAALLPVTVRAQTFTVLHSFTGGNDGSGPAASLTLDNASNLYGTASYGGGNGMGTVFKLANRPSGWTLTTLYSFTGGGDGATPLGGIIFGPDGSLYGNTSAGANPACNHGCGAVYNLRPQPRVCNSTACPWQETTLYGFIGGLDGGEPQGNLLFNAVGDIYGTTEEGTAYGLTPLTHSWVYRLTSDLRGHSYAGLISDATGNLFGTTYDGGGGLCYRGISCGTVFELTPVGSSWHLNVLHSFQGNNDGGFPTGALISDRLGNLYGANNAGTVFMLSPSGGVWTFNVLYQFQGECPPLQGPSCGPRGALAMDASGALYGTAFSDGAYQYGSVFKLTPSNGSWVYTGGSDGTAPEAGVTLDASGNIYGTTTFGGSSGCGVVFEITP